MMKREFSILLGLGLCVFCSALMVVYTTHINRGLHSKLQELQSKRDELHVEWTQLLLEQGVLGSEARVEKMAREELGMVLPLPNQMVVISP